MIKKDYYEILGIPKSAGDLEIKRAYKRLAIKYHPDRNKGSENKFKEIKEAYEILIDSQKRSSYDQYGHAAFDQNSMGKGYSNATDFSDIFGDVFGDIFGGRHQKEEVRGSDLQYDLEINLEEAVFGSLKNISIPTLIHCNSCRGIGTRLGVKPQKCLSCHGSGQIQMTQGFFTVQQTCPTCRGRGNIIKEPCNICKGKGLIRKIKTLSIKIPVGINHRDKIRLNGEGEAGPKNTPSGDLYIKIYIKKHEIFERENNNLYCEVPIDFSTAALGGEITVPTLDGKINLKVPAETQTGKLFRIRGKGIKSLRNSYKGDFLCRVIVETPINLNENQKSILQKFRKTLITRSGKIQNPRSKKFLEGVKKFFNNLTH